MYFACSFPSDTQSSFLTAFSALAWCVWKQRNLICFEHRQCSTGKTIIISIMTTMLYWTGTGANQEDIAQWMPADTNLIPVQVIPPDLNSLQLLKANQALPFDVLIWDFQSFK
jgi:hypothetical protein